MGERWYRQESLCSCEDAVGAVFRTEDIEQALCCDLECLDLE